MILMIGKEDSKECGYHSQSFNKVNPIIAVPDEIMCLLLFLLYRTAQFIFILVSTNSLLFRHINRLHSTQVSDF